MPELIFWIVFGGMCAAIGWAVYEYKKDRTPPPPPPPVVPPPPPSPSPPPPPPPGPTFSNAEEAKDAFDNVYAGWIRLYERNSEACEELVSIYESLIRLSQAYGDLVNWRTSFSERQNYFEMINDIRNLYTQIQDCTPPPPRPP